MIVVSVAIISAVNPLRWSFFLFLYKKIKSKTLEKKTRQGRDIQDSEFEKELRLEARDVIRNYKEDFMSVLASWIILFGVYEVKDTYQRVHRLLKYRWRHSEIYRWLNRPKKNQQSIMSSDGVVFGNLNWMCIVQLGEYLDMRDKLVICMVSKKSRYRYMSTPFIWIHYYLSEVSPESTAKLDSSIDLASVCVNDYRYKLAELNNDELDFKLGVRFILKEEAIRSVINLPQLISSPYVLLSKLKNALKNKRIIMVSIGEYLDNYRQSSQNEHQAYEAGGLDEPIVYYIKFRSQIESLTSTMVPEDFQERMNGFELVELCFYKVALGLISLFVRVYGVFFQDVTSSPNGVFDFVKSLLMSLLRPLFLGILLVMAYYLLRFYYSVVGMDFLHSLAGPLGLHILISIVSYQVQMHPKYSRRSINPFIFLIILKNATFTAAVKVGKPLYEFFSKIFKFILYNLVNKLGEFFKSTGRLIKGLA